MAQNEHDHENLLAEATALVERVELLTLNDGVQVVAGFRRDGAASFYLGADLVYQFNATGELRRAYRQGKLLKAEQGKLVQLERERTAEQVQLVRHELSRSETRSLLAELDGHLRELGQRMSEHRFQLVGQVPSDTDVVSRVVRWLAERPETRIAATPRV